MSTAAIAALTTRQFSTLRTAEIASLTTNQVHAMTSAQLHALSSDQVHAMTTTQTAALSFLTPIVLDLNGDGVQTTALGKGVQFDLLANGNKVNTGWTAGGDGLLALDRNHDGVINDGSELFGSGTTLANGQKAATGYQAMAELDTNGDGTIDAKDSAFADLRVWVDGNADGVSQADELKSLADLGITKLNLDVKAGGAVNNGNILGLTSTFETADGATHAAADVWFATTPTSNLSGSGQQPGPGDVGLRRRRHAGGPGAEAGYPGQRRGRQRGPAGRRAQAVRRQRQAGARRREPGGHRQRAATQGVAVAGRPRFAGGTRQVSRHPRPSRRRKPDAAPRGRATALPFVPQKIVFKKSWPVFCIALSKQKA